MAKSKRHQARTRRWSSGGAVTVAQDGLCRVLWLASNAVSWTVYLLRCRDGSLYTGATNDLPKRLAAHRAGTGGAYTRSRRPLRLVYAERRRSHSAALRREAAIKRLTRSAKLALVRRAQ